jgi:hypothetical protein
MVERRGTCRVLVGKSEGKRPLGRCMCRRKDAIKIDLQETGLGDVDWIDLAQGRGKWWVLVILVMNLRIS